jgi:hypothetical protein
VGYRIPFFFSALSSAVHSPVPNLKIASDVREPISPEASPLLDIIPLSPNLPFGSVTGLL